MKGLSNVISSVLILAVSISLVSIYAGWAPDFANQLAEDAANDTNRNIKCSNAALSLENATYDLSGQATLIDLENTGTIRFTQGVRIGAFNSSSPIARKTVPLLEVGETEEVTLESEKVPDTVVATSEDCPELKKQEDSINVQK